MRLRILNLRLSLIVLCGLFLAFPGIACAQQGSPELLKAIDLLAQGKAADAIPVTGIPTTPYIEVTPCVLSDRAMIVAPSICGISLLPSLCCCRCR